MEMVGASASPDKLGAYSFSKKARSVLGDLVLTLDWTPVRTKQERIRSCASA